MARYYRDVDDDNYEDFDSEEDLREEGDDNGPFDPTRAGGLYEPLTEE